MTENSVHREPAKVSQQSLAAESGSRLQAIRLFGMVTPLLCSANPTVNNSLSYCSTTLRMAHEPIQFAATGWYQLGRLSIGSQRETAKLGQQTVPAGVGITLGR